MNMYLVLEKTVNDYHHGDEWETPIVVGSDKHKLEKFIETKLNDSAKLNADIDLYDKELKIFLATLPPVMYTCLIKIPKWDSGLSENDITKEMQRIKAENDVITENNKVNYDRYALAKKNFTRGFFDALDSYQDLDMDYIVKTTSSFRIKPIDFIE